MRIPLNPCTHVYHIDNARVRYRMYHLFLTQDMYSGTCPNDHLLMTTVCLCRPFTSSPKLLNMSLICQSTCITRPLVYYNLRPPFPAPKVTFNLFKVTSHPSKVISGLVITPRFIAQLSFGLDKHCICQHPRGLSLITPWILWLIAICWLYIFKLFKKFSQRL